MEPDPEGCAIHPAALLACGLGGATLGFLTLPALRWLCIHVDALRAWIIQ